jgi:hypothetical protein
MICLGATDTIYALASASGVQYTFDQDVPAAGADVFGTGPQGALPTGSAASIFAALGAGITGVARIMMVNTGSGTPGTTITLYKNGATYAITTFLIPPGGSATFDGIEPRVFNSAGTRQ